VAEWATAESEKKKHPALTEKSAPAACKTRKLVHSLESDR
jgi:hypothetical protein